MITAFAQKLSSETRNSTTALTTDADLTLPVTSGVRYIVRAVFMCTSPATPDFKFRFQCSVTGYKFNGRIRARPTQNAEPSNARPCAMFEGNLNTVIVLNGSATSTHRVTVELVGFLYDLTANGNFRLDWGQNTSDPGNTTVLAGSFMALEEV